MKIKRIRELIAKYKLDFWASVAGKIVMITIAVISGFTSSPAYYSLAMLYGFILIVRVTTFFINENVEKKYKDDIRTEFQKKHLTSLYSAILLLLWIGAIVPINAFIPNGNLKPDTFSMMYFVFIPWAVFRFVFEIVRIIKYKKTKDPYVRSKTLINIFSVFTVVIKMFGDLYFLNQNVLTFVIIASALILTWIVYTFTIAIYLSITAIRGLSNKREEALAYYMLEKNNIQGYSLFKR